MIDIEKLGRDFSPHYQCASTVDVVQHLQRKKWCQLQIIKWGSIMGHIAFFGIVYISQYSCNKKLSKLCNIDIITIIITVIKAYRNLFIEYTFNIWFLKMKKKINKEISKTPRGSENCIWLLHVPHITYILNSEELNKNITNRPVK